MLGDWIAAHRKKRRSHKRYAYTLNMVYQYSIPPPNEYGAFGIYKFIKLGLIYPAQEAGRIL